MVESGDPADTPPRLRQGGRKKWTATDRAFDLVNYSLMTVVLLAFLYPLLFVLSASFSRPDLVFAGQVWLLPKGFNLVGYEAILKFRDIWTGYRNSLLYVALGVPVSVTLTLIAAYPLSRKDFYPRAFVTWLYAFTMFFSGGLIPTYLLVRSLGLLDNILVMVVGPGAIGVWNIVITRTFFQSNIPQELREAAEIDGCSDFTFFFRVVLPLSAPIVAVISLFYAVETWNAFFMPMIYFTSRSKYPLQLILREIFGAYTISTDMLEGIQPSQLELILQITNSIRYGSIIVASVPVLLLYPLAQRYFVKGIMIGAIKG